MNGKLSLLFLLTFAVAGCTAQVMETRIVKDGLFIPWELLYGPDGHIWFTQKNGYICRLALQTGETDTLYHEPEVAIRGEGGMLGMAMHPAFPDSPYLYVAYDYLKAGVYTEKIVRYTYNGQGLQSPFVLLDDIAAASYHNGCRLLIVGGKLFITTGDAGTGSRAQDLQSRNGKVLRINLDGTVPADNPLPGNPVWAWGLRNSQGLTYANDRLYGSEHGPDSDDECNILLKGRNYGWPAVTGYCNTPAEQAFCNDSNVVEPLRAWTPTLAVSRIAWYGTGAMFPALQRCMLMTTLKDEKLYRLQLNVAGDSILSAEAVAGVSFGRLRAVCVAPDGRIFLSTSNSPADGSGPFTDRIIELYDPQSIGIGALPAQRRLTVYPNPAAGRSIRLADDMLPAGGTYTITDIQGRVLRSANLPAQGVISVDGLAAGSYFLQGRDRHGRIMTGRFVRMQE